MHDGRIIENLTNKSYGRLTVISYSHAKKFRSFWKCKCTCGTEVIVRSDCLKDGNTQSCGCLPTEINTDREYKHGQARTKLYRVWASMKNRCNNPNDYNYKFYGGKGVTYCPKWEDYMPFYKWAMENGYREGLTIDRIDNDGNYEPNNCRWVSQGEQLLNTSRTKLYTFNGKTQHLKFWAEELGIKEMTLFSRINTLGWSVEKAFTTPVR